MAHHGGAGDLAEGADMRQARGAVAGLEDHLVLAIWGAREAGDDLARLLERPGIALLGEGPQIGNGGHDIGHRILRARPPTLPQDGERLHRIRTS